MKKLLVGILLGVTSIAYAHKIELVTKDGYMPFTVDSRISFFITKEYTDNLVAPRGTIGLFIVTVDCNKNLYRRVLTEVFDPITETVRKAFKTDSDVANAMGGKSFVEIIPELLPVAAELCKALK
jgi:hypothetical protein